MSEAKTTLDNASSKRKKVLITGASGSMGSQVLKCVMGTGKFDCVILLRKKRANEELRERLLKKYAKMPYIKQKQAAATEYNAPQFEVHYIEDTV